MHWGRTQTAGIWVFVVALFATLAPHTASAEDKGTFGYWKAVDKDTGKTLSIFRLWEDKGKLIGKILKTYPKPNGNPPQHICTECSGAQKGKPVNGLIFLWGFVPDSGKPGKWVDGKVLNPEDGKVYNCEATLSDDGKELSVYGYIRIVVKVGGTSVWKRPTAQELKDVL